MSDASEAKELAAKLLRKQNKYERTATFKLPGNTRLVAGVAVALSGFGGWDANYIIKQAKHTVDASGGYTTQVTLRRVLEGY